MKMMRVFLLTAMVASLTIVSSTPARAALLCMGLPAQEWTGDAPAENAPPNDDLEGGPGHETIHGTSGNDVIIGGGGNDIINGNGGKDLICGDDDSNPLEGDDQITGGADTDVIYPGAGADHVDGGASPTEDDDTSDQLTYKPSGGVTLNGVKIDVATKTASDALGGSFIGNDTFSGVEVFGGTPMNDELIGSDETDDYFAGYGGDDEMLGKGGTDAITYQLSDFAILAFLEGGTATGDGEDTFSSIEYLVGSEGGDYLVGSGANNVIFGGSGNDYIYGRGGNDPLVGEAGNDQIYGGVGELDWDVHEDRPSRPVDVNLTAGNSVMGGTRAACLVETPPSTCEVDKLYGIELAGGSNGNDILTGNNGANYFFAEPGHDTIDGKGGHDVAAYFRGTSGINADLGAGGINITGLGNDRVKNVEGMTGTIYSDVLRGSPADNFINALEGNDKVFAEGGRDYILTGPGKDRIDGGGGRSDLLDFASATEEVEADLQAGKSTGEGNDTLKNLEELSGSANGDVFKGNAAANKLLGGPGRDKLFGRAGNDALSGQEGTDQLNGEAGKDSCNTKSESKNCETYKNPKDHPLFEVSRRYKRLEDLDRRYKRRYK